MADVGITRTCATYFISEYFRIFLLAFASSYSHCRALHAAQRSNLTPVGEEGFDHIGL